MGWLDRSKYKRRDWGWWDDVDEYNDNFKDSTTDPASPNYVPTYTGGSTYGTYGSWYKPKYDMSVSLETRVVQLIKTITGKSLRLRQAQGWGNDDQFFFYNPKDLENASDDEVLGRILHQLAKELFIDVKTVEAINNNDPEYKHLVNTLEDNRADAQLQSRYAGCGYYAEELWHERKFKDNPMSQYAAPMSVQEWIEATWAGDLSMQSKIMKEMRSSPNGATGQQIKQKYDEYLAQVQKQQNDAWEFLFNINAFQNGEVEYDFSKNEVLANFTKATPFIKQYLEAPTIAEAMKVYPEIKKLYPKPTKQQQQEMDNKMSQTEGLSAGTLKKLKEQAMAEQAQKENGVDAGSLIDRMANRYEDPEDWDSEGNSVYAAGAGKEEKARILERNLAKYKEYRAENAGAIANLHALIRSILIDNAIKRFQRPFKRGKLDAKSMYKYLATQNLRIFKKPRIVSERKYTMAIMVDQSGSMGGSNSRYAVQATIILAEVFEQLGLPYEILGFDQTTYVFKKFDRPLDRALVPALDAEFAGGGTDDREALKVLKTHMLNFDPSNQYHKGFFVISDGVGRGEQMKELVTEIEAKNNATVFGIGIGSMRERDLKRSYNHSMRINNVKDLPNELITLMRGQFRRHG